MLALLLLSTAFASSSTPVPIPSNSSNPIPFALFEPEGFPRPVDFKDLQALLDFISQYRALQDIIWSSIATIFACTWVAVHPNIPGPWDSGWTKFKQRMIIMIFALLAPELMTLWAMRQWVVARRIAREYNAKYANEDADHTEKLSWWRKVVADVKEWFKGPTQRGRGKPRKWTITHGFFLQMGGFLICDDETPICMLTFNRLDGLIEHGYVAIPKITEEEITDRSKGDFLTKLLVVVQTTWFLVQCLARWGSGLTVTELELVTLAFSALNIITYRLWWKKPQNVQLAITIPLLRPIPAGHWMRPLIDGGGVVDTKEHWVVAKMKEEVGKGWIGWVIGVPRRLVQAILRPLGKLSGFSQPARNPLRPPMFYVDGTKVNFIDEDGAEGFGQGEADLPIAIIGVMFGALHLIPWFTSSDFPSRLERWLWRASAVVTTAEPVILCLMSITVKLAQWLDIPGSGLLALAFAVPSFLGLPLYLLARFIILVVAFSTLRALHEDAYRNIEWTTFLPHI